MADRLSILSTLDMIPIWSLVSQQMDLPVDVMSVSELSSQIGPVSGSDLFLVEAPCLDVFVDSDLCPSRLLVLSGSENESPDMIPPGYRLDRVIPFRIELYGSQMISARSISCFTLQGSSCSSIPPLVPTHGPNVGSDGKIVLWDARVFSGRGTSVSRDDADLIDYIFRATMGRVPLWVSPGFPFLATHPLSLRSLGEDRVEGLLCSSIDRSGGWVVLTRRDVLDLLGHPGDVPWSRIPFLIGIDACRALLGWAALIPSSVSG